MFAINNTPSHKPLKIIAERSILTVGGKKDKMNKKYTNIQTQCRVYSSTTDVVGRHCAFSILITECLQRHVTSRDQRIVLYILHTYSSIRWVTTLIDNIYKHTHQTTQCNNGVVGIHT